MKEHALWVGRFQPPTIAHLVTLETILQSWKKLTVGIIVRQARFTPVNQDWARFIESTTSSTMRKWKNPFNGDEVKRMWQAALAKKSLADRVDFLPMPQIGYQSDFETRFPESLYDFVEVEYGSGTSPVDQRRRETFEHLLRRKIHFVRPPYVQHNTAIRRLVAEGKEWSDFLPEGTLEVFLSLNGPDRMTRE